MREHNLCNGRETGMDLWQKGKYLPMWSTRTQGEIVWPVRAGKMEPHHLKILKEVSQGHMLVMSKGGSLGTISVIPQTPHVWGLQTLTAIAAGRGPAQFQAAWLTSMWTGGDSITETSQYSLEDAGWGLEAGSCCVGCVCVATCPDVVITKHVMKFSWLVVKSTNSYCL